jgi:hypothetical protein
MKLIGKPLELAGKRRYYVKTFNKTAKQFNSSIEFELSKEKRNLSQGQIKIRILAYLFKVGGIGANSYTIQHRSHIPSQDFNRFRRFLEELCSLDLIESYDEETSGERKIVKYRILEKGIKSVELYRNSVFPEIFGPLEEID